MNQEELQTHPASSQDVLRHLEAARSQLGQGQVPTGVETVLADLSTCTNKMLAEHNGMVEELLSAYEQLGIVFEVTQKLPNIRDEGKVLGIFVSSLQSTFSESSLVIAYPLSDGGWTTEPRAAPIGEWLGGVIERARKSNTVLVEWPPSGAVSDSISQVMVGPLFCGEEFVCAIVFLRGRDAPEFRACDMLLVESLTTFCGDVIRTHRLVRELRSTSIAMVRALVSAVDQKDEYTSGHSVRVGYFAALLGKKLRLKDDELQMLQWSALLHDIGKIGIRDDVLKKAGKLTDDERLHIMEHPVRSYHVVKEIPQLGEALDGVLHHHEHYDGNGYPDKLAGDAIPLQARIIQVADVFDALTSCRSYRQAFTWPKALSILEDESGSTVDPGVREVFDRLMRDLLRDDPSNWEVMAARAEQFAQSDQSLMHVDEGD